MSFTSRGPALAHAGAIGAHARHHLIKGGKRAHCPCTSIESVTDNCLPAVGVGPCLSSGGRGASRAVRNRRLSMATARDFDVRQMGGLAPNAGAFICSIHPAP